MRARLTLLPLLAFAATPAMAAAPAPESQIQLPPELTDPAFADHLSRAMATLSKAFLNIKVGEMQAALEGRNATAAEKKLTIRDVGKLDDKDFERRMTEMKPQIQQSMKALQTALPDMMKSLGEVQKSIERAAANMPDPTYPKR